MATKQPHEFQTGDKIKTSQGIVTITGPATHGGPHMTIVETDRGPLALQNAEWQIHN